MTHDDDDTTGRLHPEGAPGITENIARIFLGDRAYEESRRAAAEERELTVGMTVVSYQAQVDLVRAKARVAAAVAGLVSCMALAVVVVAAAVAWRVAFG